MAIKVQKAPLDIVNKRNTKYPEEREAAKLLKVGEGFVWKNPPSNPRQTVIAWRNHSGVIRVRKNGDTIWVICVPFPQ